MAIIVNSIITSLTEDRQEAIRKAVGILEVPEPLVQSAYIAKTSLDARRRGDIRFVHSVSVTLADGEARVAERAQAKGKKVVLRVEEPLEAAFGPGKLSHRPVIAGFVRRASACEKRIRAADFGTRRRYGQPRCQCGTVLERRFA